MSRRAHPWRVSVSDSPAVGMESVEPRQASSEGRSKSTASSAARATVKRLEPGDHGEKVVFVSMVLFCCGRSDSSTERSGQ